MEEEKTFTIREQMALRLLAMFFAVIKPTEWKGDWDKELKEIQDLAKK